MGDKVIIVLYANVLSCSHMTFISWCADVCALGAVIAKHAGDERLLDYYLRSFKEIELPKDLPYEVPYGRASYLWVCSFSKKHIGKDTITTHTRSIVEEVVTAGRQLAQKGKCPLMYEWHGKKYWGAAHGLA